MAFLDDLIKINQQNFLGGLAKMGQAIKEQGQNETLVELYNKFKADREGLLTTHEQADALQKKFKDAEKPADVDVTAGMFNYLQKMDALTNLYQPFITSFATLGDDGVKVAERLTNELAAKLTMEEKKGQIPWRELEFKSMQQTFNWNADKYDSWVKDETLKRDSLLAADWMLNSEEFDLIPLKSTVRSKAERNAFTTKVNHLIEAAYKYFDGKLSKGAIATGLSMAMNWAGKGVEYSEPLPNQMGAGVQPWQLNMGIGNLQQWSQEWDSYTPELREAIKTYAKGGTLTNQELAKLGEGIDSDYVKEKAERFGAGGKYMEVYNFVTAMYPQFAQMSEKPLPIYEGSTDLLHMPVAGYHDIYRPATSSGFVDDNFRWNAKAYKEIRDRKTQKVDDINSGSIFIDAFDEINKKYGVILGTQEELENLGKLPFGTRLTPLENKPAKTLEDIMKK